MHLNIAEKQLLIHFGIHGCTNKKNHDTEQSSVSVWSVTKLSTCYVTSGQLKCGKKNPGRTLSLFTVIITFSEISVLWENVRKYFNVEPNEFQYN